MFSSKKKNVELNLMFISQANNIGKSKIPVSLSRDRYFALRYLSYTVSFISSRGVSKSGDPDVLMKKYSHRVWIGGMVSSQSKWYSSLFIY